MMKSAKTPVDQSVRDGARKRLSESWLLEAGAGTGKTTVLLDRVEEILRTNIPLDRVAIITFTEKAAGELKLKLRQRMEKMISATGGAVQWSEILRESLESLDRASVGTIHSFAASLLKERPVEAGVDPRFSVADALTTAMLMEECWDRWLDLQSSSGAAPLGRVLRLGLTLKQIRGLAFDLVANRDVAPLAAIAETADPLPAARVEIASGIARMAELSASCVEKADDGFAQIRRLEAALPALAEATGDRLLARLAALPFKKTAGSQKNWSPGSDLALVKKLVAELGTIRDEAVNHARMQVAHELAGWLRNGFLQAYRDAKESRRLLDFTDMLVICRNMLRRSPAARVAFQNRYDSLLVDEFQDTDPLQAEILFLLAADDPRTSDWRLTRPKPGKLFVVGDPKQSIYRFRRADIEIYDEACSLIAGAGGVTPKSPKPQRLTQNFRTLPSIVSWVNDLFGILMKEGPVASWQPSYQPIAASREADDEASRVILLVPEDPGQLAEAGAGQVREAEARHVVGLIGRAVTGKWPVVERETGESRPMRWRDIALLFRTGTALEIYEEILRENSIPYRISGGKRYYMRAEMRALQAVISAIESPHDALAVVSALRSQIFGHSDEDLLEGAASRAGWVYTHEGAGAGTPFEKSFELLARLHLSRNQRPVSVTLEDLFESTGALALFLLKPDGEQRAANLLKAIDMGRAHEAAGGVSFGSFARFMARMASEERDEGEAPLTEEAESNLPGEEGDAIHLMTVHKAKGLEFPMVILCDNAGRLKGDAPRCLVERGKEGDHIEFSLGTSQGAFDSSGYRGAVEREKTRLAAETVRLFYVATTRARDYLVVPVYAGKRGGGFHAALAGAGFLPPTLDGASGGRSASCRGARIIDSKGLSAPPLVSRPFRISMDRADLTDPAITIEREAWSRALQGIFDRPPTGRVFRSASGLEGRVAGSGKPALPDTRDHRRARAIGIAVHAVLQRIDLATAGDIGLLSEEEALAAGEPDASVEVRGLVGRTLEHRIVKEALSAPRLMREMPFAAAGETWLTEGRIDLVFESGDGLTIVDFKTDQVETEREIASRVEVYLPQAMVYALALSQVTGVSVRRVVFLFVRPGVEKTLKVDEAFLAAGRRLLETGSIREIP